jgi:hypothetical protein
MFPVAYTGTTDSNGYPLWQIADNTNWCNYGAKRWANAVTVVSGKVSTYQNATPGTPVPEADILGYWVYIPRFAYEVERYYSFNAPVVANNFNVNFETAATTKKTPQAPSGSTTANASCYTTPTSTSFTAYDYRAQCGISRTYGAATGTTWGTHPAFTVNGQEINGFWMAKFETSGSRTSPQIKANQITNISETIGTFYDIGKSMGVADSGNTGGSGTSITQNNHNLAAFHSRMASNTQWGAAAYLTASVFGAGYNGVQMNGIYDQWNTGTTDQDGQGAAILQALTLVGHTGCGPNTSTLGDVSTYGSGVLLNQSTPQSPYACSPYGSTTDTTHGYSGSIGMLASTTNNIYGIYDMNGGAYEFTAANYNNVTNGNITTMFPAIYGNIYLASSFGTKPAWSSSSSLTYYGFDNCNWTLCGGQGNYETTTAQSVTTDQGWNGNYTRFNTTESSNYVYSIRSGCGCDGSTRSGIFSISNAQGVSQGYIGFRATLGRY